MRWERLFADLEAALEAEERAAADGDLADLVRAERAGVALVDRLRAHVGARLGWTFVDGLSLDGDLLEVGPDWVLVQARGTTVLIRLPAVRSVDGLSGRAAPQPGEVARRLGLGTVLRGLARDRAYVVVRLVGDGSVSGTVDRVGADHVDVAVHPRDEPRRRGAVIAVRCLPLSAVVSVDAD